MSGKDISRKIGKSGKSGKLAILGGTPVSYSPASFFSLPSIKGPVTKRPVKKRSVLTPTPGRGINRLPPINGSNGSDAHTLLAPLAVEIQRPKSASPSSPFEMEWRPR